MKIETVLRFYAGTALVAVCVWSAGASTQGKGNVVETLPGQGVDKLYDSKLNPTCAWKWTGKSIEVETDFGE